MQNLRRWRKKLQFCMWKMKLRDYKNANTLAVGEKVNAPGLRCRPGAFMERWEEIR